VVHTGHTTQQRIPAFDRDQEVPLFRHRFLLPVMSPVSLYRRVAERTAGAQTRLDFAAQDTEEPKTHNAWWSVMFIVRSS
jgi:hypothetical protein